MKKHALILADGSEVEHKHWKRLVKSSYFIALDGAANSLKNAKLHPDMIAGDFDQITPATLLYWKKKGTAILHTPDQNLTDMQKALAWCLKSGFKKIFIFQALGNRMDHSFSNLSSLKKFDQKNAELIIFTETETIRFKRDQKISLSGKRNRRIAIVPFPKAKITSYGLGFEMKETPLILGKSESVSNYAAKKRVTLKIQGSALIIEEGLNFSI
jgi:thiamine pyrophosphokinase